MTAPDEGRLARNPAPLIAAVVVVVFCGLAWGLFFTALLAPQTLLVTALRDVLN